MPDFETKARRILRKLASGARLQRCGAAYVINGTRRRSAVLTTHFVADLAVRRWIREERGDFVISQTGKAWLDSGERAFVDSSRLLDTRLVKDDHGRERYVVVNAAESPLALLHHRGDLTASQFEAAEKLRRDFTIAELTPRMGVNYGMPVGHGGQGPVLAEAMTAARRRFNAAMRAVGPELSGILFDVCCFLKGVEDCEHAHQWPRRTAKVVLGIALDRLAGHYGMRAARRRPLRSWNAPDPPSSRGAEEGGGRV